MKKTIPFDLEKAKSGHKIITRDGTPVTEWKHFETCDDPQTIIAIKNGTACSYDIKGHYMLNGDDSQRDLFLLPKETSVYRNVYADDYDYPSLNSLSHTSLDNAIAGCKHAGTGKAVPDAICVLRITTTELGATTAEIVHNY